MHVDKINNFKLLNHNRAISFSGIMKKMWKEIPMMLEQEFKRFLENDPNLTGNNGIPFRLSKGRKAERLLGVSLDTIVANDDLMYDALMKLKPLENPAHNPMQNVLRKYYLFKNNCRFPRLNQYKR